MGRVVRRVLAWASVALLIALAALLAAAWQGLGARATGERRARMEASGQWRDGQFVNPEPIVNHWRETLAGLFATSPVASPVAELPIVRPDPARFRSGPPSGLRITWLGHSTSLIEIDGVRVLTDPSWSERSSPIAWLGPKRWFPPPIALDALPPIDAVVISHDHYDHLDHRTIAALRGKVKKFVVPLGIGVHLAYWGVPDAQIVELDWWDETRVGPLRVVCTPARHAAGRALWDRDQTLWSGWALRGPAHAVFFSGDTGLFSALRAIGERLGPFDATLIEVGQYHAGWPDWHIGPEQAVLAHQWLRGRVLVPVHWGKLQLAYHGWTEPIERTLAAAQAAHVDVLAPRPGESVEPGVTGALAPWWPALPWQRGEEAPIVSGGVVGR